MGFFKAYDMRGAFGADFDLNTVRRVGAALPRVVGGRRWLVGRDGRLTSPEVRDALVTGLLSVGAEVTDLGICSTPMVYFFTAEAEFDGSVMVTASHNPPGDNGLKVSKCTALPVGYADGLDRVEQVVRSGAPVASAGESPSVAALPDALPRYLAWQRAHAGDYTGLRLAVDCSNGSAALFAREMFPGALLLNDVLDGRFPGHAPNPLLPEARAALVEAVRKNRLDAGVIFDGDADRVMFVDERGVFVPPDQLIPLVARATRKALGASAGRAPRVLHDVRTGRGALAALASDGFVSVPSPVGHAFAKPLLRQADALCGGELAGHYYFREFHGCDSGLLAATRILGEVATAHRCGQSFSQLMAPIAAHWANSGELNFRVADKDVAVARLLAAAAASLPRERKRDTLDGIRLEFDEGWVNVRPSNTEPYLRLILECDTPARLATWRRILTEALDVG